MQKHKRKQGKIYIGTSGWAYQHWKDVFYPQDLQGSKYLHFYIKKFKTVEINSSFYHLPREDTFQKWYQETPKDFIFSVKASRYLTHLKRLKNCQEPLEIFLKRISLLKKKLGVTLFQMPPSFRAKPKILEDFLKLLLKSRKKLLPKFNLRTSFELRHKDCFCKEIYNLLKRYNMALCFADTPIYPCEEIETADFIYLRLHGHAQLYASCYSKSQLKEWAKKIKKWQTKKKDVYCYFDNDTQGYAVKNALELIEYVDSFKE